MKINQQLGFGLLAGTLLTALVMRMLPVSISEGGPGAEATQRKPLYWVAPMDPNYRRDTPGKSPMGMDLIAVYSDEGSTAMGSIRIDPDVINNLGVRTTVAQLAPWQSEIRTVGYVGFDQDRLLHIHPRVEGWVETLHVKAAGDPVKAGQAL